MNKTITCCLLLATILTGSFALASQEGVLNLGSFRLESPGIGESGVVVVTGRQSATSVDSLVIEAFGKRFELSSTQLQALQGGMLNGVQLSYEAGYKQFGGRTLYLVFSRGFTSGVTVKRFVTVNESGSIKVGDKP